MKTAREFALDIYREQHGDSEQDDDDTGGMITVIADHIQAAISEARAEEREACAKVVDEMVSRAKKVAERDKEDADVHEHTAMVLENTARAIRARTTGGDSKVRP